MEDNIHINPANILLELIEVSIHNVLFIRNLYPKTIFSLKKKYGVPVYVSRYTDLNLYITEALKTMKELLTTNQLEKVTVCFIDKSSRVIEKFVFNILNVKSTFEYSDICNDSNLIRVKEVFRAFMLKLSISDSYLKPLPEDCTFKICIETKELGLITLSEDHRFQDFPWIEVENKKTIMKQPKLIPLKALETESLHLEMYIECT